MSFYVVYNADTELFLNIVHDEAEWVANYMDSVWFATQVDAKKVIGTLIGRYPRNKRLNIIDQIRTSYLVTVEDVSPSPLDRQHAFNYIDAIMVNDL